ncbi:MAG: sulfite exporter TauE/SafE family protein [Chryseolinea sp.]
MKRVISSWLRKCGKLSNRFSTSSLISIFSFHFTTVEFVIVVTVGLLTGMSKTGIHGAGMLSVPLLAAIFGGQRSSGVMLPMLVLADVLGVFYYHRHASWHHLKILFPWAAMGVILGTVVGNYIDDRVFKVIMATVILSSVGVMIWLERGHKGDVPENRAFGITSGVLGGFTSMVGNLAGTVMAVYFLSMRLPKNTFIGTTAWFFMVTNWFKVPFHVFAWHTIDFNTFLLDLIVLPAIIIGAFLGIAVVGRLSEKTYRWFIIAMTLIAAVFMLTGFNWIVELASHVSYLTGAEAPSAFQA